MSRSFRPCKTFSPSFGPKIYRPRMMKNSGLWLDTSFNASHSHQLLSCLKRSDDSTHNSSCTGGDGKAAKEKGSPNHKQQHNGTCRIVVAPMECIIQNLSWNKTTGCFIAWIIEISWILKVTTTNRTIDQLLLDCHCFNINW